MTGRRSRSEP